jgi:hypothetical protein
MFVTLSEDITSFVREVEGEVVFTRVAIAPAQIECYDLPTAPAKEATGGPSTARRARPRPLAPDAMNQILRRTIEQRTDRKALERVLRREKQARRELAAKLGP